MQPRLKHLVPALALSAACVTADDGGDDLDVTTQNSVAPNGSFHWDHGVVHYNVSTDAATELGSKIDAAITEYETLTGLDFVEERIPDREAMTIYYVLGARSGCIPNAAASDSPKGFIVTLCPQNGTVQQASGRGTIVHETGHCIGIAHEATRPDRNLFVTCHPECIDMNNECSPPGGGTPDPTCVATRNACTQRDTSGTQQNNFAPPSSIRVMAPYDVHSTMQYDSHWLSNNPSTCFPITDTSGGIITNEGDLSSEDINTVKQIYNLALDDLDPGSEFGEVMAAGDFDNDGYVDVAIAAPSAHSGANAVGAVYLYKGTYGERTITATSNPSNWHTQLVSWDKITPSDFGKTGQDGEEFGAALRADDFNKDGIDDLAIGAPGRNSEKGAVYIMYGHAYNRPVGGSPLPSPLYDGLEPAGGTAQYLDLTIAGLTPQAGDHFGKALGSGTFGASASPFPALAIGVPGRGTGKVVVMHHPSGPDMAFWKTLSPPSPALTGDQFGLDISAHDWDGDDKDDIVVGAPQDADAGSNGGGRIYVYLSSTGMAWQATVGLTSPQLHDAFGTEMESGDFFGLGVRQLAVGAPGRNQAGRVLVLSWNGTTFQLVQTVAETTAGGSNNTGDRFGDHLRAANLRSGPYVDLVVGVPRKNPASATDAGRFYIIKGSNTGLSSGTIHDSPLGNIAGAMFGKGLTSGDFDHDGRADLLVGAMGYPFSGVALSFQASASGLTGSWQLHSPILEDILP